jgi:hypothetical protein
MWYRVRTKKNPHMDFLFYESCKSQFNFEMSQPKAGSDMFASVLQNSFVLVFKEMDHCCVVCCIALQI